MARICRKIAEQLTLTPVSGDAHDIQHTRIIGRPRAGNTWGRPCNEAVSFAPYNHSTPKDRRLDV